jgi:hypothetical protein
MIAAADDSLRESSAAQNPAYRLARHKLFESKDVILQRLSNVTPV